MILNGEAGEQKQTKAAKSKNAYGQLVVFPFVWYVSPKIRSVIFLCDVMILVYKVWTMYLTTRFMCPQVVLFSFFFFFVNRIKITNMR